MLWVLVVRRLEKLVQRAHKLVIVLSAALYAFTSIHSRTTYLGEACFIAAMASAESMPPSRAATIHLSIQSCTENRTSFVARYKSQVTRPSCRKTHDTHVTFNMRLTAAEAQSTRWGIGPDVEEKTTTSVRKHLPKRSKCPMRMKEGQTRVVFRMLHRWAPARLKYEVDDLGASKIAPFGP
jgi:hypothetical protein